MRKVLMVFIFLLSLTSLSYGQVKPASEKPMERSIYDFKVKDISGNDFDFASLKGKKFMIVNTASKCGYTGQYEELQKLYETYKDSGFVIISFPSASFGQEFKTDKKIKKFCDKKYGITFPMMSKTSVTGGEIHPIYKFLTDSTQGVSESDGVDWNFQKYLIDVNGHMYKKISPETSPATLEVIEWIVEE